MIPENPGKRRPRNPLLEQIQKRLIERVRVGLAKRKKNQRDITYVIDIPDAQMSKMMKGERKITAAELYLICGFLQMPIPRREQLGLPKRIVKSKRVS